VLKEGSRRASRVQLQTQWERSGVPVSVLQRKIFLQQQQLWPCVIPEPEVENINSMMVAWKCQEIVLFAVMVMEDSEIIRV
jgi:hypothetical protein